MPGTGKTACVNAIIKKLRIEYQNLSNINIKKNNKSKSKSKNNFIKNYIKNLIKKIFNFF